MSYSNNISKLLNKPDYQSNEQIEQMIKEFVVNMNMRTKINPPQILVENPVMPSPVNSDKLNNQQPPPTQELPAAPVYIPPSEGEFNYLFNETSSPPYAPGSQSPQYQPGSPPYLPGSQSPQYQPGSPLYLPGSQSPQYQPGSPPYAPGSPPYAPGSPPYAPGSQSPQYQPGSPPYAQGSQSPVWAPGQSSSEPLNTSILEVPKEQSKPVEETNTASSSSEEPKKEIAMPSDNNSNSNGIKKIII
jgi:hypothetical protein